MILDTNQHTTTSKMAMDLADEIVVRATLACNERRLSVELNLCKDNDDFNDINDENKSYAYFKNVPFEIDDNMGSFNFSLNGKQEIIYEGFPFSSFVESLKILLLQYVLHAQYLQDLSVYDVILLSISEGERKIPFCFHLASVEVPSCEPEAIVNEIFNKILDPIQLVFSAWRTTIDKI
jgi:hypothetical protein